MERRPANIRPLFAFLLVILIGTFFRLYAAPVTPSIIPQPRHMQVQEADSVTFPTPLLVYIPSPEKEKESHNYPAPALVRKQLTVLKKTGFFPEIQETSDPEKAHIFLCLVPAEGKNPLEKESYALEVRERQGKGGVHLSASDDRGFFYAWQTVAVLMLQGKKTHGYSLPQLVIRDSPLFEWRGLHLDVSRHFFGVGEVEKLLDTMSLFKLNTLHLHLTDGPGWRLEIKKYPELTKTGAWRVDKTDREWNWPDTEIAQKGESRPLYGGYYTQQDISGLIAYARERNITIVPEIDMPGHSYAALFAYRHLACTGNNVPVDGLKGKDVLCVGNPETGKFVRNILDELINLFPADTPIHIGGDEVDKKAWLDCRHCRERMKKEGLASGEELQTSFIKEITRYLNQKGREVIAWDEVLTEGTGNGCTLMVWHDDSLGRQAAEAGYSVILTPASHLYFDYYQGDPAQEPRAIGGFIPLEKVFQYRPADGISPSSASRIRGIQGNIWTEYIKNPEHLEYMAWPRGIALAERAWSPFQGDYASFLNRLTPYLKLLDKRQVRYRAPDKDRDKNSRDVEKTSS